jgi:hypothetical protein
VWTTIATSIVFAAAALLFQYRIVTLESLAYWLGVPW